MQASPPSWVIILNGAGSVGKSSTARAVQALTREPFLHVAMDAFLDMMPGRLWGRPDGLVFEQAGEGTPSVAIHTGPVAARVLAGMRGAVAAMAAAGNHLIVDDVLLDEEAERDYRALLAPFNLRWVGLHAPLDVLEARERARGDREIGLARWQFDRVHAGRAYDFEVDTQAATPEACAAAICRAFGLA